MAYPLRVDEPGTWLHLMNRGVDRSPVYRSDTDRLRFEELLGEVVADGLFIVHAYCLMGNHYHLLVQSVGSTSAAMQRLGSSYTRIFNVRHERDGPLFRSRFRSVLVEGDDHLVRAACYIHRNPIDLVPVEAIAAYRWSSYGVYLGRRASPAWLTTDVVAERLTMSAHRAEVERVSCWPTESADRVRAIDARLAEMTFPADVNVQQVRLLVASRCVRLSTAELATALRLSHGALRTALSRARHREAQQPLLASAVRELVDSFAADPHAA